MKNLAALKTMDKVAETGMKAFWAFDKAAFAPGALDVKTKQMMALAVALTTQCPYCIEIHTGRGAQGGCERCRACGDGSGGGGDARRGRDHPRDAHVPDRRVGLGEDRVVHPRR